MMEKMVRGSTTGALSFMISFITKTVIAILAIATSGESLDAHHK